MRERSIGSWRRRFSERLAFQQTEVGLRDGVRAMDKVLSQILEGELGRAWPRSRAGRCGAEGERKIGRRRHSQLRNSAGGMAEGRRGPCAQAAREELGGSERGHDVSGGRELAVQWSRERLSMDRPPQAGQTSRSIPVSLRKRSHHVDGACGVDGTGLLSTVNRHRRAVSSLVLMFAAARRP